MKRISGFGNTLRITGAICAFLIGAGVASGQDILQFFTSHGKYGFIAAIIFLALACPCAALICRAGQREAFENPYDVFTYYCGAKIGNLYIWFSVILGCGSLTVMLAGAGATVNQLLGIPVYAGTVAMAGLAICTAILGIDRLINILGAIGPVNAILLIILGLFGLHTLSKDPYALDEAIVAMQDPGVKSISPNPVWSGILYAFLCLLVTTVFMVNCAASAKSQKEAGIAGGVSFFIFAIVIVMLLIAELANYEIVIGAQIPTLAIARSISPLFGIISFSLIILAIFSATSSLLLMIVRRFAVDRTKRFRVFAVVFISITSVLGSIIPFDELVSRLFTVISYVSIFFVCRIVYKELFRGRTSRRNEIPTRAKPLCKSGERRK
ncbi:MAG: hypothetical protein LBK04_00735 [Clostridiales Family XIII bacterium]|nr:hypothetical protein [Clostridiales Family XIII bacterium]